MKTQFLKLILLLCICSFKNKERIHIDNPKSNMTNLDICSEFRIGHVILDYKTVNGKAEYKKSQFWDDFEPNDYNAVSIPDSIEIDSSLDNFEAFFSDKPEEFLKQTPSIYVSAKMQLKFSIGTDCMNTINP
jgi:hypothetical protein